MNAQPRYKRSTGLAAASRRRFRLPYPIAYALGAVGGITAGSVLGYYVNAALY